MELPNMPGVDLTADGAFYTPVELVEAAREVMGSIDLDPASCPEANRVVRATRFYTRLDDGLQQPWSGTVFLNPPRAHAHVWARRLQASYLAAPAVPSQRVTAAVLLTNARVETRWFQELLAEFYICFPFRRVKFWRPGDVFSSPMSGSACTYFGKDPSRFVEVFSKFGSVVRPAR